MIEKYIRDYLRSVAAIRNRVDQGANYPGIYAGTVPMGHKGESIRLEDISAQRFYHLAGEAGVVQSVVQVTCYGENARRAFTLSELVRNRLSGYRGYAGDSNETAIQSALIINESADQESPADASDRWIYSYTCDYQITHTTSIPTLA
jgi:hypothetical protein